MRACTIDLATGRLSAGRTGALTGRELSLLTYLSQRAGRLVSREELTVHAFGYSPQARTRAVDKAVHGLRRKVEVRPAEPDHLLTCTGAGYRFVALAPKAVPSGAEAPFVGRAAALARLRSILVPGAVVTIKGPPGMGKTRLVTELVRVMGQPASWVALDGVESPSQLERRMCEAAGLAEPGDACAAVASRGDRLWVFDGAVPDLDWTAGFAQFRAAAPQVCWIRTSEAPLGDPDEQVVVLGPLSAEEATRMFRQRAERRGYPLDDEAIRQLVPWMDGLPLAVSLTADRIGPLGVADLAQGLERRDLDLLTWVPRTGPTLWDRLEQSWARVADGDRHLLEQLATVDGPVGVDGLVTAVGWPASRVLRGVERLVDASWIGVDDVAGHVRLTLLGTTRQFLHRRHRYGGILRLTTGLYSALPSVRSTPVSRSSSALLLREALTELEATGPGVPSGPSIVTLVELLAPVVHTRVSRVLLRHAAHRPQADLRQEVEDQVQAVFAKLFAERGRILRAWDQTGGLSLANWVGRFAQLRTNDAVRRGMRGPWFHDPVDPAFFDSEASADSPEAAGVARELWMETRRRVLENESTGGREMFALLFDEERSVDDIVIATKRSRAAVLKWRSRLRQSIRHELAALMSEARHDEA